jgi:hypothetical protein
MRFATEDDATFRAVADARAAQKFNHLRGFIGGEGADAAAKPRLAEFSNSSGGSMNAYATSSTARASRPI